MSVSSPQCTKDPWRDREGWEADLQPTAATINLLVWVEAHDVAIAVEFPFRTGAPPTTACLGCLTSPMSSITARTYLIAQFPNVQLFNYEGATEDLWNSSCIQIAFWLLWISSASLHPASVSSPCFWLGHPLSCSCLCLWLRQPLPGIHISITIHHLA